jgi:hypothetical protein
MAPSISLVFSAVLGSFNVRELRYLLSVSQMQATPLVTQLVHWKMTAEMTVVGPSR